MESDTIVAIVTPPGEGGVGIVRASGPRAASLPLRLFSQLKPPWPSHKMRHGEVTYPAGGRVIDRALGCSMLAPHSYTGEDVFEIHCHGSPMVLDLILQACLHEGCRLARPGEFTLRAFLNNRMDLSQAEAVIDVVRAQTNTGLDLAVRQLSGWLSERIDPMRDDLMGVLAHMEAMVDFVEDDIPPQLDSATRSRIEHAAHSLGTILEGAEQGIVLREGATLAIVGSPNVGKSSIMNALLGLERSIVTPMAGTTRDTIEETVQVGSVAFRTIDTAGITESEDVVERMGVDRSKKALHGADIILLVLDKSRPITVVDESAFQELKDASTGLNGAGRDQRLVVALNKDDLAPGLVDTSALDDLKPHACVSTSARRLGGVDTLRKALEEAALGGHRHEYVVGNVRHQDALRQAVRALRAALDELAAGTPLDLVSFDVRAAVVALGEITGADVDEELLERIFRDFCIGK